MVRTVELASGEVALNPPEELLVICVHAESDLGLAPVTAEVALADEDAEKIADFELLLFHRQVSRETEAGVPLRVVVSPSSFP